MKVYLVSAYTSAPHESKISTALGAPLVSVRARKSGVSSIILVKKKKKRKKKKEIPGIVLN